MKVRQSVGKYMGGDYYILPSSIHELIVMPKDYAADLWALEQTVRDVNRGPYVPEEEFLSDNVYRVRYVGMQTADVEESRGGGMKDAGTAAAFMLYEVFDFFRRLHFKYLEDLVANYQKIV